MSDERFTNTQAERLHDPREDKSPPTQARLPWIVQMMWDAGLYTQAREVQRLGDAYFALSSTSFAGERKALLTEFVAKMKEASERRYKVLRECEAEAHRWKAEGDMYGWNYHAGRGGGCNESDIIYYRVQRWAEEELKKSDSISATSFSQEQLEELKAFIEDGYQLGSERALWSARIDAALHKTPTDRRES